jgi:homoaconitase/3-isopropylmalate dehydratase large subunit
MVHFETLRFNDPNFQFVEMMGSTYTDHGPMIDALSVTFNNLSIESPNDPAMSILKDIISQYLNDPDSKEFNDLNEMAKMMTSDDDELIVKEIDNFFEEINPGMKTGDMVTLSMTADFGDYLLPLFFFHSYFVAQSRSESTPVTMDTSQPPTS